MKDKKQVMVSAYLKQIDSWANKYYEFTLPTSAKKLDSANIRKKEICISEAERCIKFDTSLNLILVYVEQETLAIKVHGLTLRSTVFEERICQNSGNYFKPSLAPDTIINLFLLKPNLIAVQAKLHIIANMFSNQRLIIDEPKFTDVEIEFSGLKERHYAIPGVGTINISLENRHESKT